MSAGFKVVAEAAEQQSHPSSVDYCSLWSFICPRMSGRQRQQAVIHRATAAARDPRWNETSNFKTPIRIKIPVTLVEGVSKLIQIYNPSGCTVFVPSALEKKSIPYLPSLNGESYWLGGGGSSQEMMRRKERRKHCWGHCSWWHCGPAGKVLCL